LNSKIFLLLDIINDESVLSRLRFSFLAMGLSAIIISSLPFITCGSLDDELINNLGNNMPKKELINGFLQKPIHLGDLLAEVNNQVHAYELEKESFIKIR
jgi:hypothetical protein